jgi:hypothetical protein
MLVTPACGPPLGILAVDRWLPNTLPAQERGHKPAVIQSDSDDADPAEDRPGVAGQADTFELDMITRLE